MVSSKINDIHNKNFIAFYPKKLGLELAECFIWGANGRQWHSVNVLDNYFFNNYLKDCSAWSVKKRRLAEAIQGFP